jgi:hypothetical protein
VTIILLHHHAFPSKSPTSPSPGMIETSAAQASGAPYGDGMCIGHP